MTRTRPRGLKSGLTLPSLQSPGLVPSSTHSDSFSVVTLFTRRTPRIGHSHHTLIREGGKTSRQTIRLIINCDFPLLTRVMLALVQNKKSHLKPGRNKRRRVAKHFMSQKEHACAHKIVPRARNYDLNCTRTTLTAEHKSGDRCISCRQNTGCEKLYLCIFTTKFDRK